MRTQPGFRDWLYPEQPHVSCSEKMQRAQTTNSFATDDTILEVVSNAAGATPPHWPAKASPAQVSRIPGPHLTQQFYQLPTGGRIADKARRVLMHLGVRPSAAVL